MTLPDWHKPLTVRTANALFNAGLLDQAEVASMPDHILLRVKGFGRRSLDELRSKGLRHNSCESSGCVLVRDHAGLHVPFESRYARQERAGFAAEIGPEPTADVLIDYLRPRPELLAEIVRRILVER